MMKHAFSTALVLGAISGFGLVGCADKAKDEVKVEHTTPTGTTTETQTTEVKTTEPGGVPATTPAK